MHCSSPRVLVASLFLALVVATAAGPGAARAQQVTRPLASPDGLDPTAPAPDEGDDRRVRIDRTVLGSAAGTAVGIGLGLAVGSAIENGGEARGGSRAEERLAAAAGAAVLLMVAGGPVGATAGAGVDDPHRTEALLTAGLGQFIGGAGGAGLGAGTVALAGGKGRGQEIGAAVGAAVGAVLGSVAGALSVARDHGAVIGFRKGRGSVGLPAPSVRLTGRPAPRPALHVPVVRVRL
jgi:hypothetical protein